MAIAEVVAQRMLGQGAAVDSAAATFSGNVVAGNLLIAAGTSWLDTPGNTSIAVTDTRGTTYTVILGAGITWSGGQSREFIAYGIAPSSGGCTVTVNPSGTGNYIGFGLDEFSGVHATPLDVNGGESTGTGTTYSDSLTTATDGALVIASACTSGTITLWAPGSGYTLIADDETETYIPFAAEFRIVGAAGSYTADFAASDSRTWAVLTASFKVASAAVVFPYPRWSQLAPILAQ